MSQQSSHYPSSGSPQAQIDDPDEVDDFRSSALVDGASVQRNREHLLLGGRNTGQQTYGFGSPDGSRSVGFGQSTGYGTIPYNR